MPPMGREPHMLGTRHCSDFAYLCEAPTDSRVHLNHVHCPGGDQVAAAPSGHLVLTRGDKDARSVLHLHTAPEVIGLNRLLEPIGFIAFNGPNELDGGLRVPSIL